MTTLFLTYVKAPGAAAQIVTIRVGTSDEPWVGNPVHGEWVAQQMVKDGAYSVSCHAGVPDAVGVAIASEPAMAISTFTAREDGRTGKRTVNKVHAW